MPEPFASCRGLSKTYTSASGAIEALRAVDAAFALGEVNAVVGASGSGKSTLLRLLAGLDRPTNGELLVVGRDLAGATPAELRRHRRDRVTYISQKAADNLVPHLTLRQHASDTSGQARELLTAVGLGRRLDAQPRELSGGEQARAAFALALARRTPLIVLDEPTAELDPDSASALIAAIRQHAGGGRGFVIATHDPDLSAIADGILRLDRGRAITSEQATQAEDTPAPHSLQESKAVLEARAISKSYRRAGAILHAVDQASLGLRRGELGVLIGRSGSGKSTLLTLLAGWQKPDTGLILANGDATDPSALSWAELGYLPQRFGLIPELTIRENVALPIRLAARADGATRIDQLLDQLGLTEHAGRHPSETSIGQQQRAALARALVLQPAVLLADEPTSHQDAGWRDAVWHQLRLATQEGTACLTATHEEHARRHATQLWQITGGVVTAASEATVGECTLRRLLSSSSG